MRFPQPLLRDSTAGRRPAFVRRLRFVLLLALLAGCSAPYYRYQVTFRTRLAEVDPPGPIRELQGEPDSTAYDFADERLRIQWSAGTDARLDFVLMNRTDDTLRVLWQDARYVDEHADTHAVLHATVTPDRRERLAYPAVIPPRGRLVDYVLPEHLVEANPYAPGQIAREWPLLRLRDAGARDMRRQALRLRGRRVHILLPVADGDATRTYRFSFQIDDVQLR